MQYLLLVWLLAAGIAFGVGPEILPQGKQRYVNDLYGYELTYSPEQFDVLLTGSENERDGAQLSVVYREYAALAPRLDIQVHPRVQEGDFFKALNYIEADFKPERFVVSQGMLAGTSGIVWRARNAGNADESSEKILQLELYKEGVVLRFRPPPTFDGGIEALYGTQWWQVMESFRLKNNRDRSILRPGEYHAAQAPLFPGYGWLSLLQQDGEWRLEPEQLTARRVRDLLLDSDDSEPTGISIEGTHADAFVFLRCPSLVAGAVQAIDIEPAGSDIHLDMPAQTFEFGGSLYQLSAVTRTAPSEAFPGSYALLLSVRGKEEMVLNSDEIREDLGITVSWVGDLNHDGFLDLIIDTSTHNHYGQCWYLSSAYPVLSYQKPSCYKTSGC